MTHAKQTHLLSIVIASLVGLVGNNLSAQTRPNIILFLADDQSWNGTSVMMDPNVPGSASDFYRTPNLDALAARGMRFANAYASAAVCSPTRAAIQTGMSPAALQFTDIDRESVPVRGHEGLPLTPPTWQPIDTDLVALPERVREADASYITAHVGKWHVTPSAEDLGYDFASEPAALGGSTVDPAGIFGKTQGALDFISDRGLDERPFFLQLSHFAVHNPIVARPEIVAEYQALPPGTLHKDPTYAAFTQDLDLSLGMVVDHLAVNGMLENTFIIYASDNGGRNRDSSNAPLFKDKAHLWEGGIRTPLVIAGPGINSNTVSHVPVTSADIYSTISDLVGNHSPLPESVEGASLAPLLFNDGNLPIGTDHLIRQHAEGGALYFHQPHNHATGPNYRIRPVSAIRDGDYKLVRQYGENGNPDDIFLFNLANNLTESDVLSSPLNLADDLPTIRDSLLGKLDTWLQGVDASFAYDVAKPVEMLWRASAPGAVDDEWRSVIDIDQRQRETFFVPDGEVSPTNINAQPYQTGLGDRALSFDGNARFRRHYLHVSDAVDRVQSRPSTGIADFDRSVTVEAWFRLDELTGEHMLFESGDSNAGMSITIGDSDGDGVSNDLRIRLLGDDGNYVTSTVQIDRYFNPTRDFVKLAFSYDDSEENRGLSVYINGAQHDFVSVEGDTIDWDGYSAAHLGFSEPSGVGANGGGGALPFASGGFRGEIAEFRILNHASTQSEIESRYGQILGSHRLGITAATGDLSIESQRSMSYSAGETITDGGFIVLNERNDRLEADLSVDIVAEAGATYGPGGQPAVGGTLLAGSLVSSFLLHNDSSMLSQQQVVEGSVTFAGAILGIIVDVDALADSNRILGSAGAYEELLSAYDLASDILQISADKHTLSFNFTELPNQVTNLRVITEFALTGDFNNDGIVDAADYTVWRDTLGQTGDFLAADGDGSGTVDAQDYTVWRSHFGMTIQSSFVNSSGVVPEPSALGILAIAGFAVIQFRRRQPA